ncbi:hypothetical protein BC830DRAFT_1201927 [Chytriomyces sp. MP71]|nr:hypothetical protein BC830DRAFT_1201927 [Chytriomyces sp. MP71]
MLALILAIATHVLSLLVCQWSVNAKAALTCKSESDPHTAKLIKIIPGAHQGAGALCSILAMDIDGKSFPYFFFQKKKYIFNFDKKQFVILRFPADDGKTMKELQATRGLINDKEISSAPDIYGLNRFNVPSTVVFQRHKILREFRAMSIKPCPIKVYRNKEWREIPTDKLNSPITFCILFAGKIDVACFDKTGTLTAENLLVEGVSGFGTNTRHLFKSLEVPKYTTLTLAGAHALVQLDDGIIGDPMEKNTLESIVGTLTKDEMVRPKAPGGKTEMKILRMFQFSSALKRMSTLSLLTEDGKISVFVSGKALGHARESSARFGYRIASDIEASQIFFCPLKPDSAAAIEMLNNSSHRCVMITGDNALTACHVAKEVRIVSKPLLILDLNDKADLSWQSVDETVTIPVAVDKAGKDPRLAEYELCTIGRGLSAIFNKPCFVALLPRIWVYARVSPSQKKWPRSKQKFVRSSDCHHYRPNRRLRRLEDPVPGSSVATDVAAATGDTNPKVGNLLRLNLHSLLIAALGSKSTVRSADGALNAMLGDMDDLEAPTIKFGDASVAAPFTSSSELTLFGRNQTRRLIAKSSALFWDKLQSMLHVWHISDIKPLNTLSNSIQSDTHFYFL